jgi:hypothetical protein
MAKVRVWEIARNARPETLYRLQKAARTTNAARFLFCCFDLSAQLAGPAFEVFSAQTGSQLL